MNFLEELKKKRFEVKHSLATSWTVRGSNTCLSNRFCPFENRPDLPWGTPTLLFSGYRGSSAGVKRPGRDLTTNCYIALKLRISECLQRVDKDYFIFGG